jgi:adenine-specific DNA-methyltransferase
MHRPYDRLVDQAACRRVDEARLHELEHLSYGDRGSGNRLVQGDNTAVLTSLSGELRGRVRCVYIDPPYNSAERWVHYHDKLDHEAWLAARARTLRALWPLLRDDGSLWISIDDGSMHYLKVLADDVCGRASFVTTVVWEHRTSRENRRAFSNNHEYLLVYARDPERFRATRNLISAGAELRARYQNPDDDPRGPWQSVSANAQAGHGTPAQFYELVAPSGRRHVPPKGRCWVYTHERMRALIAAGQVWFGRDGNGVPRLKRYLADARLTVTPETLWTAEFSGTTRAAKRHLLSLLPDSEVFETPKPEQLVARVLEIATGPGDLVLDAYLGSGTTAAAAMKLGRRWLGIESGEHVISHCVARLRAVVDGERGGISADADWHGGGGFRFLRHPDAGVGLASAA